MRLPYKIIGLTFILLLISVAVRYLGIEEEMTGWIAWIGEQGMAGPVIFVILYIISCVFLLPGFILTMSAGAMFGIFTGGLLVSVGATIGAVIAFLIGRNSARGWVWEKIKENPRLFALDMAVYAEGWKIILLARLCPAIPFRMSNYAFGMTNISLGHYALATWAGTLPSAFTYVYVGAMVGGAAGLGKGPGSSAEWILYGLGFISLIILITFLGRMTRNILRKHMRPSGNDEEKEPYQK